MASANVDRREMQRFQKFILSETDKIITLALDKMDAVLFEQAVFLANKIKTSDEFTALKTPTLIGQFGFTPEEVARLDDLFPVIGPNSNNEVTSTRKTLTSRKKSAILQWVDFDQLKFHEVADHPLTKLNDVTGQFEETGIVSWIEWWENGVTVRGHIFTRGNIRSEVFSRSGFGFMQQRGGSTFAIRPTRIFEKTGAQFGANVARNLQKAFIELVGKVS